MCQKERDLMFGHVYCSITPFKLLYGKSLGQYLINTGITCYIFSYFTGLHILYKERNSEVSFLYAFCG